ncbi:hypothetical protein Syun_017652 [Stephania yunnanensis]|uniref:non-specific serine/threonine protein kinase n=1 Tax=Stephania yunnanensis TaxID=152371 RepID=A0AAP0J898_9MAGN
MQKEQGGLEGRNMAIGNLKIQIRNAIAEGGFSYVYLARDNLNISKQYALKHIICNEEESLELVMREISVMKSLKGHPNVVSLLAHTILDMGQTKEEFLVMEFCEKSLVNVLERRGAGYFEEKQVLTIFKDVCNAAFAMHCYISTNHKRFERPEEMGIEEDNIRKYTTPACKAPEMWDLFRRKVISEKVGIWALGCLLYRICYFKYAFDGESKLQILNGNYRIPALPKYSAAILDLIRGMLQASPDDGPDITQVWFRVNEQLPENLQKSLEDWKFFLVVKRSAWLNSWWKNTQNGVFTCSDRMPDSLPRNTRCAVGRIADMVLQPIKACHVSEKVPQDQSDAATWAFKANNTSTRHRDQSGVAT